MRHISTLTAPEGAGLWDAVMPDWAHKPFCGSAYIFSDDGDKPARVCFMSGLERLGVTFNGRVWADSDLQTIELDADKVRAYFTRINIEFL